MCLNLIAESDARSFGDIHPSCFVLNSSSFYCDVAISDLIVALLLLLLLVISGIQWRYFVRLWYEEKFKV